MSLQDRDGEAAAISCNSGHHWGSEGCDPQRRAELKAPHARAGLMLLKNAVFIERGRIWPHPGVIMSEVWFARNVATTCLPDLPPAASNHVAGFAGKNFCKLAQIRPMVR